MRLIIFALSLAVVHFCGCDHNKNNFDFDMSTIYLTCIVSPDEDWPIENNSNVFGATCYLNNSLGIDLSDTAIFINNTRIPATYYHDKSQVVFYKSGIGSFHTGDTVRLSIYNSRFSVKDVQLTIPELTPPEFITNPDFPPTGSENFSNTYSISWRPIENVSRYRVGFELYNHEINSQDQDFFSLFYSGEDLTYETSADLTYETSADLTYETSYDLRLFFNEDKLKWIGITLSNLNMIDVYEINDKSTFWATGYKRRLTNIIPSDL